MKIKCNSDFSNETYFAYQADDAQNEQHWRWAQRWAGPSEQERADVRQQQSPVVSVK